METILVIIGIFIVLVVIGLVIEYWLFFVLAGIGFAVLGPVGAVIGGVLYVVMRNYKGDEKDYSSNTKTNHIKYNTTKNTSDIKVEYNELSLKVSTVSNKYFQFILNGNFHYKKKKRVIIELSLVDITDNLSKPVYFIDSGDMFAYSIQKEFPYKVKDFTNMEICKIDIESLIFANKGKRKLYFICEIYDKYHDELFDDCSQEITFYNHNFGYEDEDGRNIHLYSLVIKLAFAMSMACSFVIFKPIS